MTREQEILHASKQHKNALFDNYGDAFIAGARWADEHPKDAWISINKELPWERKELRGSDSCTKSVLVRTKYGGCLVASMERHYNGELHWIDNSGHVLDYIRYWMPVPSLPK